MNWDTAAGHWKNLKGRLREKWGLLMHDSLSIEAGKREQQIASIQIRYGRTRDVFARIRDGRKNH